MEPHNLLNTLVTLAISLSVGHHFFLPDLWLPFQLHNVTSL